MAPSTRGTRTSKSLRIALLVAANAACLFLLWKVALGSSKRSSAADEARAPVGASTAQSEAAPPAKIVSARDERLESRIRARIAEATRKASESTHGKIAPSEVHVSVHVRALTGAPDLASIDADRSMRPASNLKLVTTAAALVSLGPKWAFETLFESAARVEDGSLKGDLIVHAGADPLYSRAARGDAAQHLSPVVAALKSAGITHIEGALVLDEGTYQAPAPAPAWPTENQHWQEFCALAGGFSINAGCITALVESAAQGYPARVDVRPNGHGFEQKINVTTGAPRSALDVRVSVLNGVVRVDGSIPKDVPSWEGRFAAPDPVALFGGALERALQAGGIEIQGGVRRERTTPSLEARALYRVRTPLFDVLEPINTWSNNACADQLFLALAHAISGQGTRAGGRAATALALEKLGIETETLVQVDGSGLSRDDRVTARQITGLIDGVMRLDAESARAFHASLAVGGEAGTLDRRLGALAGRVHAKTGFIGGTSALSGLIDTNDGRTLVFSILVEYPTFEGLNSSCWKPMEDAICADLAGASG